MTVRDLINKLMSGPLEDEIGISIRKRMPNGDEVIYVGAKDDLKITGQEHIWDPRGVWLEAEIKDGSQILHTEGIRTEVKENVGA